MYLKVDQTEEVSFTLMFNTVIFNVIMKINFKYLGLKKWYWGMSSLAFK